jgi:LmbE family N-acetylglucosaminyl deacetylase
MAFSFDEHTFIPVGSLESAPEKATISDILGRTTHLCIVAHSDDAEIMAYPYIDACFKAEDHFLTVCVITNGNLANKGRQYARYTDEDYIEIRRCEQQKAAIIGEYNAVIFLDLDSATVKSAVSDTSTRLIRDCLMATKPSFICTHNVFDVHATHKAVLRHTLTALKQTRELFEPKALIGFETWGSLDWLPKNYKLIFDCSHHQNLQRALIGVFDSQISRDKCFDEATMGRRMANATFSQPLGKDAYRFAALGIDQMPLLQNECSVSGFVDAILETFRQEVLQL